MPVYANIFGPDTLIVIGVIALLFGSTQLTKLARSLGSAKSEFEKGQQESSNRSGENEQTPPQAQQPPAADNNRDGQN